jgi:hypothetical protein
VWQRAVFDDASRTVDAYEATRIVTRAYRHASTSETPVHAWGRP